MAETFSSVTAGPALPGNANLNLPGNYDLGATTTGRATSARIIFARHLYCLMMYLLDNGYTFPVAEPALTPFQRREITATRIAQWAVNVVDFVTRI